MFSPSVCLFVDIKNFSSVTEYIKVSSSSFLSLCAAVIEDVLETSMKTHSINFYYGDVGFSALCHINLYIKTTRRALTFQVGRVPMCKKKSRSDFVVSSSGSTQNGSEMFFLSFLVGFVVALCFFNTFFRLFRLLFGCFFCVLLLWCRSRYK